MSLPLACSDVQPVDGQAGVDEAGCGSLMGPLVAAAIVLPMEPLPCHAKLRDSKTVSAPRRAALAAQIRASAHVGVGVVEHTEIDEHGLGWARREVFQRALRALPQPPPSVVVDGSGFFEGLEGHPGVPYRCIPKADGLYQNVAAASLVAKSHRDECVHALAAAHPEWDDRYQWSRNKGYPTAAHIAALREWGVVAYHRKSFGPCRHS